MSLESWKAEFYPVEASKVKKDAMACIEHSIKKWEGLTKASIKKYGLSKGCQRIFHGHENFPLDSTTCALCHMSQNRERYVDCRKCPISIARGSACNNEYAAFCDEDDVRPMLQLLRRTKKTHSRTPRTSQVGTQEGQVVPGFPPAGERHGATMLL